MIRHRVTILVPTCDGAAVLADALESALVQTAPRSAYRVLVVDDASTDDTPLVLRRFRPAGIDAIRLDARTGTAGACNAALEHLTTPFFVRLESGDHLDPEAVEALLERADETGADIVSCDRWDEGGGSRRLRVLTEPPEVRDLIAAGTLLPADLVRAVGGYRPVRLEGFDLYLRLLEELQCVQAHVPRPLYTSRAEPDDADPGELRDLWSSATLVRHGLVSAQLRAGGHGG